MASFVSALDRPNAAPRAAADTNERLRECLRFLRHVERVDVHADMARNWDARKCFVLHVTVKDDEVDNGNDAAGTTARLLVVRPTAPFQIERTPKELQQLKTAMHQWSSRHPTTNKGTATACAFCRPIVSGAIETAARHACESAGSNDRNRSVLSSLFNRRAANQAKGAEWEAWLNGSIEQLRRVDADTIPVCEGLEHVPALVARFLLQEFASDVIL